MSKEIMKQRSSDGYGEQWDMATGKDSQGLYVRVELSSVEPVKTFVAIIPELLADERLDHSVRMEYKKRFMHALEEMGCGDELGTS